MSRIRATNTVKAFAVTLLATAVGPIALAAAAVVDLPMPPEADFEITEPAPVESELPDSNLSAPFFNESGACDDPAGHITPASTTNSLPNRALPAGHQVRGPWGDFFGRNYSDVAGSLVPWTVPMSGSSVVMVHERALPAFQKVTENLAAEAADGKFYSVDMAGSFVWRRVGGSYRMSTHAFGTTIDINWTANPATTDGSLITNMPGWFVDAFEEAGFCWGGSWSSFKDPMHFSWKGPIETPGYGSVPEPYAPKTAVSGYTDRVFSKIAQLDADAKGAEIFLQDGTRDGVADLYSVREWGDGGAFIQLANAQFDYRWCSVRQFTAPGADVSSADDYVVADADGDGRPDLVLIDASGNSTDLEIFTFRSLYGSSSSYSIPNEHVPGSTYLFGDLDSDGLPDLFVVEPGSDTTFIVLSAKSGFQTTIASQVVGPNTASGTWRVSLGDFDVDGLSDIALFKIGSGVELRVFHGSDGLSAPSAFSKPPVDTDLNGQYGITDWDGDGRPDIIVHRSTGRIRVYLGGDQDNDVDFWFQPPEPTCPASGTSASADYNGDRISDLTVGIPGEDADVGAGTGALSIIYSDFGGPDAIWKDQLRGGSNALPSSVGPVDGFGTSWASGDFDGDGFTDVAIGSPDDEVNGKDRAGSVEILYGTDDGLDLSNPMRFTQDTGGVGGSAGVGAVFGRVLATGDLDRDGFDDLVIGAPGDNVNGHSAAGTFITLFGSRDGLVGAGSRLWSQKSTGIQGGPQAGDRFASSLAVGDFDGDGYDDVAAGVPFEDVGEDSKAGAVNVIPGSSSGLTSSGDSIWTQASSGVKGSPQQGDRFGLALASADFDADGRDDLSVGVPFEDEGADLNAGKVNVLFGSSSGITAAGDEIWSQGVNGLVGKAEDNDRLGLELAGGDINGDGFADLVLAAPRESLSGVSGAGAVFVLYGSSGGLAGSGSQVWTEATSGIPGSPEKDDWFGSQVGLHDFNGDGFADLVVGAPREDIGSTANAGKVWLIFSNGTRLTSNGSFALDQASAGVQGSPQNGDQFGRVR